MRQAEDPRQLGDVEPLAPQDAQEPEPRLVAKQPVEASRIPHINKSTLIDVTCARGSPGGPLALQPPRPVVLQEPRQRTVGEQPASRLARRTVVAFVLRVH